MKTCTSASSATGLNSIVGWEDWMLEDEPVNEEE